MVLDTATARQQVLDAADDLFYERGVQSVGMDAIRTASGVSLKRLYQLFPSKETLVEAYLDRREILWQTMLADHVEAQTDPRKRILAVFDFLYAWSSQRDYRGCAFINAFGELGAVSPRVAEMALRHKEGFRQALTQLAREAGSDDPDRLADHLILLSEGAITRAAISGSADPALSAREAATMILDASLKS
ncbi:TetR/AcrR family transcriptional regulator [Kribbella sp. NPDC055110]